jgi:hypothetical protein
MGSSMSFPAISHAWQLMIDGLSDKRTDSCLKPHGTNRTMLGGKSAIVPKEGSGYVDNICFKQEMNRVKKIFLLK